MIFWDDSASSHTLSIAFNTSIRDTEKLIDIKRQMERHESNGRNARWQATQTKNKLNKLLETKKENKNQKDAEKEYEQLLSEHEEIAITGKEWPNFKPTRSSPPGQNVIRPGRYEVYYQMQ